MRRWVLLVPLLCFVPLTFAPVDGPRLSIEHPSRCIVQIGGCSGVLVGDRILLTAKHCTLPDELTVRIEGRDHLVRKVFTSPEVDGPVAFLVATEIRLPGLPLAAGPPDHASENPFQQSAQCKPWHIAKKTCLRPPRNGVAGDKA